MDQPSLNAVSQAQAALSGAQTASQVPAQSPPLPLAPLHLPTEPGLWPLAWGWWALFALLIVVMVFAALTLRRRYKRNLAKKAVLDLLAQTSNKQSANKKVAAVNDLLRQVCLSYYPRPLLASLSGSSWYAFLDSQRPSHKNNFQANQASWQQALYQKTSISDELADQLHQQAVEWIKDCLPPSKKQLQAALSRQATTNSAPQDQSISGVRASKVITNASESKAQDDQFKSVSAIDNKEIKNHA